MNLVIRALTLDNRPLSEALIGSFGAGGGTIGRSDTNTIALPDPERHISRLQAEVTVEGGRYLIRNAGAANPILLNGRALASGERAPLAHRDELKIGGYLLVVLLDGDDDARTITKAPSATSTRTGNNPSADEQSTAPPAIAAGRRHAELPGALAAVPAASANNPFGDLLAPGPAGSDGADPFAFLGAPGAGSTARPATPPPTPPAGAAAAGAKLPDDFDPFADIMAAPAPAPASVAPAASAHAGAPDLLESVGAGTGHGPGIDEAFGLGGASVVGAADPLAAFMSGPADSASGGVASLGADLGTDPLAMFGSGDAPSGVRSTDRPAAFNHTAELAGAYTPPRVLSESPPREMPDTTRVSPEPSPRVLAAAPAASNAPAAPAPDWSVSTPPATATGLLWPAFCEGAGIRIESPQGLTPEQMRVIGQVLREAVDGTLRLMSVRATTKQELRAQVTTIRSRNNNPLKFSPDAQLAAEQLLQPPLRGFMAGPAAMQDAMHDLVGHSIGTMAGMRAALAGVLGRFEPQALEAKLSAKTVLDSLLPMNRKARLWDLYLQHFESIRNDAQDDFHTLFGKAFVAAYEDQLDRLPNTLPE